MPKPFASTACPEGEGKAEAKPLKRNKK